MAFTADDLAAIDRAIATGELRARLSAPGGSYREVEYRSMDDLLKARDTIIASMPSPTGKPRRVPRFQVASFADE